MPSFRLLPKEQINALGQYVKYLALRGEVERALIFELLDSDLEDWGLMAWEPEERDLDEGERLAFLPIFIERLGPWRNADQRVTLVPTHPVDWDLRESVALGRQLYFGGTANCVACHGETVRGEGLLTEYDEWTKEVVDPQDERQVRRHLALGGLVPRSILPRTLRQGVFRGGGSPENLYRHIHDGIRGMPMPPALMQPADANPDDYRLTSDDIWHLVDYIQNLPNESLREQLSPPPGENR